jgi:hypothetical protein
MPSSRALRGALLPVAVVGAALAVAFTVGSVTEDTADADSPADANLANAGAGNDDSGRAGGDHRCERRDTIALPPGLQPEGITSDGGSTFYVGSLADGRVVRGDLKTGDTERLVAGQAGRVAVGMQYEQRHDRLWVAGGPTGAVTVYDADSGEELGRWVTPGSVFLNDVTVTREAAYVTDSGLQRLAVVPLGDGGRIPDSDGATTLELTGDFSVVPGEFNANGIRALDDHRLVLVQGNTGTLFLVDPQTGATDAVEIAGDRLAGGDGLELARGRLIVVRGGGDNTVAVVNLAGDGESGELEQVVRDEDFDVPTTATFAGGRLWTVNARFDTEPTPQTEYDIVRVDLE